VTHGRVGLDRTPVEENGYDTPRTMTRIMTIAALGFSAFWFVACGPQVQRELQPVPPLASDVTVLPAPHDAGKFDAGPIDAGPIDGGPIDAGPIDAGPRRAVPQPATLPLTEADVLRLGTDTSVDLNAVLTLFPGGEARLVYETLSQNDDRAWLLIAESNDDGLSFTTPRILTFDGSLFESAPSGVRIGANQFVYWAAATALNAPPLLYRARITPQGFSPREAVAVSNAVPWLLSWPRFLAVPDGGIAMVNRDGAGLPTISFSPDGLDFTADVRRAMPGSSSAQVAAGFFENGTMALSHQSPEGAAPMISRVRISSDALVWTSAVQVSANSQNVHDTWLVNRADGDLDLYYIYPAGGRGFSLFRRPLSPDGGLGPEQRITANSLGDPSKPSAQRLPSGKLLLMFADITSRAPQGWPLTQQLTLSILSGDAPK
jgi:hypothetical protein